MELLVAMVLLGTVVVATLAGLRAAIIGSAIDVDHSRAYAWLQSGSDAIAQATYLPCHTAANAAILTAYGGAVNAATRPDEWTVASGATIEVVSVLYLSRSGADDLWGATCASGNALSPVYPQLVTLRVTDPDAKVVATIEVIKSV